jgi:peroxiredoxin Q/BCP
MLTEGARVPSIALTSDAGKTVRLADFAGKKLVVYFYPKDDTPGCTREGIAFSKLAGEFAKAGAVVVGVSRDSVERHCKFRDKYGLTVPLLADTDRKLHDAFGAWGEKVMYGKKVEGAIRSTFLVGEDGRVTRVWGNVKVDGHAEQVLAAVQGGALVAKKPAAKAAPAKKPAAPKPAAAAKAPAAKMPAAKKPAAKKPAAKK